jgi:tRNA (mo5U34)-methyltransferase
VEIGKFKLKSIGFMFFMEDRTVERIRSNVLYRIVIRPVLQLLYRKNSTPENSLPWKPERHDLIKISEITPEQKDILQRIASIDDWYHSIDLGHGVVTPGRFNHLPHLSDYHLPEKLDGMRVLDVATFDGFWAFQFEKRGASEVVTMDIETWNDLDLPPSQRANLSPEILKSKTGNGFETAREILQSKVQRVILNAYDLSPDRMGSFDMVFCGDLLVHLMNPMKALQNIRSVTSGFAVIVEPFNPEMSMIRSNKALMWYKGGAKTCIWWDFSLESLERMIKDAGFNKVELVNTFELSIPGSTITSWHAVYKAFV